VTTTKSEPKQIDEVGLTCTAKPQSASLHVKTTSAAASVVTSEQSSSAEGSQNQISSASAGGAEVKTKQKIGTCKNLAELKQKLAEFNTQKAKASDALERARQAVKR